MIVCMDWMYTFMYSTLYYHWHMYNLYIFNNIPDTSSCIARNKDGSSPLGRRLNLKIG